LHHLTTPRREDSIFAGFYKPDPVLRGGRFTTGAGWDLLILLPHRLFAGLRAVSLFTPREHRESRAFSARISKRAGLSSQTGERQLAFLKIYGGTRFFKEVGAQQNIRLGRERTHQKRVSKPAST
jgi:hypothetical protein